MQDVAGRRVAVGCVRDQDLAAAARADEFADIIFAESLKAEINDHKKTDVTWGQILTDPGAGCCPVSSRLQTVDSALVLRTATYE